MHNEKKMEYIHSVIRDQKQSLRSGRKGIEREALRVDSDFRISKKGHEYYFGSALCNSYLTTDFSESLLEIVTPAYHELGSLINFLEDSHHYVSKTLKEERLWPTSMPPHFDDEDEISIARYGKSNLAKFKTTYRQGLSQRYGRSMQAIAGLHFNYSLSDEIWNFIDFSDSMYSKRDLKDELYFGALRNIQRMNWIILYLFGASPIMSRNFIRNNLNEFKMHLDALYLPYATSLRMSNFGYQNTSQSNIHVSLNNIHEYVNDLLELTRTKRIPTREKKKIEEQLNNNILQIEDEYYATSRPKSESISDIRPLSKLKKFGVDYIELRSLDIDPWASSGIENNTMKFLEAFILSAILSPSPKLSKYDYQEIKNNDLLVATKGRKKGLNLKKSKKIIDLESWGIEILESMDPYFEIMNVSQNEREVYYDQMRDPSLTKSGLFLSTILDQGIELREFSAELSEDHHRKYLNILKDRNSSWAELENEKNISIDLQSKLERSSHESFQKYLKKYYMS